LVLDNVYQNWTWGPQRKGGHWDQVAEVHLDEVEGHPRLHYKLEEPGKEEQKKQVQSFEKGEPVQNSAAQKREWEPIRFEIVEMKQEVGWAASLEIEEAGRGWVLQKEKREGLADGLEAVVSHYYF